MNFTYVLKVTTMVNFTAALGPSYSFDWSLCELSHSTFKQSSFYADDEGYSGSPKEFQITTFGIIRSVSNYNSLSLLLYP